MDSTVRMPMDHCKTPRLKPAPDDRDIQEAWKDLTFAIGSVILGVVLIGTSAQADSEESPAKSPGSALTMALPAAKPRAGTLAVPLSSSRVDEPDFISPAVIERARQRIRARTPVHHRGLGSAQESPLADADTGQYASAIEPKLPLPNTVIARTIERIGYACGAVASVTALEGDESGAYKVTCTSGQSYRARPVRGLYHFRRW